jgi:hypothetical protein
MTSSGSYPKLDVVLDPEFNLRWSVYTSCKEYTVHDDAQDDDVRDVGVGLLSYTILAPCSRQLVATVGIITSGFRGYLNGKTASCIPLISDNLTEASKRHRGSGNSSRQQ